MLLEKYKKRHSKEEIDISNESPELADMLKQSYQLYLCTALFETINDGLYTKKKEQTLSHKLVKIFSGIFPNINVGASSISSSYYSNISSLAVELGFPLQYQTNEDIANKMRTSFTQLDKNYLKIYKLPNALLPIEEQEIQQEIPQQPLEV